MEHCRSAPPWRLAHSVEAGVNIANGGTLHVVDVSNNTIAVAIDNALGGVGTLEMDSGKVNVISGQLANDSGQLALTQNGVGATLLENTVIVTRG